MRILRLSHSAVVDAWRERERRQRDRGHEVRTLSAERWDEAGTPVDLQPRPGEDVVGVRTWGSHPALFVYDPRPLWRELGRAWDVLELHEEPFALATAEVLALRALRRQRAPYSLYSAQNIRKRYPVPFRWFERWALRHAAGLSVCNREAGEICVDKGFGAVPRLIPLGLDTALFMPGPERTPQPDRIVVGYAGRLAPHKGVSVLLDAVAADERLHLRIAGAGPQEAELRARAAALGDRVEFVGSLATEELPDFYRGVEVLAVPSLPTPGWLEQFGRVPVEAMACGTPVVASDSGALPDVVGGAGLLVPPNDPDALRAALLQATEPARHAELRLAGLARAVTCDWSRVADDYDALFASMTKRPAGVAERGLEIVLVAYGSPDLVRRALEPVASLPVTVVDNSSLPAIAGLCEDLGVRYIDPGRNGGFAFGVNTALADRLVPDGDVLLLNPDAVINVAEIRTLQRALLAERDIATVGPSQVDEAGAAARVTWPFPSPLGMWLEAVGLGRLRTGRRRGFVIGSMLLLRAEAIEQLGGLDERFFLYAEETDWAYRASLLGWRHVEVPEVRAEHLGAATSSDNTRREAHFHGSQERYYRKHFGALGWTAARAGQLVGAAARGVALRGERGRAARARAVQYVRGPVRVEARYRTGTP